MLEVPQCHPSCPPRLSPVLRLPRPRCSPGPSLGRRNGPQARRPDLDLHSGDEDNRGRIRADPHAAVAAAPVRWTHHELVCRNGSSRLLPRSSTLASSALAGAANGTPVPQAGSYSLAMAPAAQGAAAIGWRSPGCGVAVRSRTSRAAGHDPAQAMGGLVELRPRAGSRQRGVRRGWPRRCRRTCTWRRR